MEVDCAKRYSLGGSLAIVAVLALIAIGLPWLDRMVPGDQSLAPGVPYLVGCGIEITPPPGAFLDVGKSRPGKTTSRAIFTVKNTALRYVIVATYRDGSLDDAWRRLRRRLTDIGGIRLFGDQAGIKTAAGVAGFTGMYIPINRQVTSPYGKYAVFVFDGPSVVEVIVVGTAESLRKAAQTIDATFTSVVARRQR